VLRVTNNFYISLCSIYSLAKGELPHLRVRQFLFLRLLRKVLKEWINNVKKLFTQKALAAGRMWENQKGAGL